MSGYVDCGCRDCFDVAIASDGELGALCGDCEEAGCEADAGECARQDAYGGDCEQAGPELDNRGFVVPVEIGFREEAEGNGVQWAVYRRADVEAVLASEGIAFTHDEAAYTVTGWKSAQRGPGRRFSTEPMLRVGRTRVLAKQRTGVDV